MTAASFAKGFALAWGILAAGGYVIGTAIAMVVPVDPILAGAASTAVLMAGINLGAFLILTRGSSPPPGPPGEVRV